MLRILVGQPLYTGQSSHALCLRLWLLALFAVASIVIGRTTYTADPGRLGPSKWAVMPDGLMYTVKAPKRRIRTAGSVQGRAAVDFGPEGSMDRQGTVATEGSSREAGTGRRGAWGLILGMTNGTRAGRYRELVNRRSELTGYVARLVAMAWGRSTTISDYTIVQRKPTTLL